MPTRPRIVRPRSEKRILNCIPSRQIENDWSLLHASEAGLIRLDAALPPSKDLRADDWWKIGNQGSTGSCVGWATADSVVRWHFTKLNRIAKSERLSVRYNWMASKETDVFVSRPTTFIDGAGTSLKAALDIVRKFGIVKETYLPFSLPSFFPGDENAFYAMAANLRIASYFNLGAMPALSIVTAWKLWLANKGPILTRLGVDRTWDQASQTQGRLDVYLPTTVRGGHAVALVGYTPDRFIVRNSWGTGWGDRGYAYASIAYATQAFTESYGVIP